MKVKLCSAVAVVALAGAIGVAPASASKVSSTLPSVNNLGAVCQSQTDPAVAAACQQLTTTVATCAKERKATAVIACLRAAVKNLSTSGLKLPAGVKLPTGLNLTDLQKLVGGLKLPAGLNLTDIQKVLGGLKPQ